MGGQQFNFGGAGGDPFAAFGGMGGGMGGMGGGMGGPCIPPLSPLPSLLSVCPCLSLSVCLCVPLFVCLSVSLSLSRARSLSRSRARALSLSRARSLSPPPHLSPGSRQLASYFFIFILTFWCVQCEEWRILAVGVFPPWLFFLFSFIFSFFPV